MSDAPKAEILNLSVEGGTLLYETRVTGPDDLKVDMVFVVYDASGIERWRQEYAWGSDPFARAMNTQIEWPPGTFADNEDHGAWLYLNLSDANGTHIAQETKGVAFTVGRGVPFQSSEQLPDQQTKEFSSVVIENCRLEGTWAVYDMHNTANHDLEVTHYLQLSNDAGEEINTPSAQELVRTGRGATSAPPPSRPARERPVLPHALGRGPRNRGRVAVPRRHDRSRQWRVHDALSVASVHCGWASRTSARRAFSSTRRSLVARGGAARSTRRGTASVSASPIARPRRICSNAAWREHFGDVGRRRPGS